MWIEVKARFEDRPHPRQVIVYMPGTKCTIRRHAGEKAIAAGKAVEIKAPNRDEVMAWRRAG